MLFAQGCIVADPPDYRTPQRARPVLNVYSAIPTQTHPLSVTMFPSPTTTSFTVPLRSEDAGEALRALFFIDYEMPHREGPNGIQPGQFRLNSQTIAPSTYDNADRAWTYPWTPSTTQGCHFLTLVVAHRSSFLDNDEDKLDPARAVDDAAIVTWTVSVDPTNPPSLDNCPTNNLVTP